MAAVLVRPIGIALFPCLLWSLGRHFRLAELVRRSQGIRMGCYAVAAALAVAASLLLLRTRYVQEALSRLLTGGFGHSISSILRSRLHEIGELTLNAPASKLRVISPLVWPAGAVGVAALATCASKCRLGVVEVYLASYALILLLWPYNDTRFWVPVLPLLFAVIFSAASSWTLTGWKRRMGIFYCGAYTLLGLAAMAYSTWITFSGRDFPQRYGDDNVRPTYKFFYSDPNADKSRVSQPTLEVLRRYSRPGTP
jgi:hypothetical protein